MRLGKLFKKSFPKALQKLSYNIFSTKGGSFPLVYMCHRPAIRRRGDHRPSVLSGVFVCERWWGCGGVCWENFWQRFSERTPSYFPNKNFKKALDIVVRQWYNVSTSAKGIFLLHPFVPSREGLRVLKRSQDSRKKRDILGHEGGTQGCETQSNKI